MPLDKHQEQALIARAKTDPEAYGVIFDAYYQPILGYVLRRVGDVALAEDLTAETFIKSFKKLNTFTWRGVSIEAWLYRIATNEIRMYFRQKRRIVSLDELFETEGFEPPDEGDVAQEAQEAQEKLERQQAFVRAQQLIKRLPLQCQEVLVLRFAQAKKVHEIADILGKREGTVKSLLSRGLAKLRTELRTSYLQPSAPDGIVTSEGQHNAKPQEEL